MAADKPTSVAEARIAGAVQYCTGRPCRHGHIGYRWTSDQACVECKRAGRERRHADNPEQRRSSVAAYYAAHKAHLLAHGQRWTETHRESVNARARERRKRNPTHMAATEKRWRERNVCAVRARETNRRGRKLGVHTAGGRAYVAFVKWARSADAIACYWCGAATKPAGRELDHIIPLAKGGADAVANLCIACRSCNRSKSAKLPEEFAGQSELRLT